MIAAGADSMLSPTNSRVLMWAARSSVGRRASRSPIEPTYAVPPMNSMSIGKISVGGRWPAILIRPSAPRTVNVFRALSPMYASPAPGRMCTRVVTAPGT